MQGRWVPHPAAGFHLTVARPVPAGLVPTGLVLAGLVLTGLVLAGLVLLGCDCHRAPGTASAGSEPRGSETNAPTTLSEGPSAASASLWVTTEEHPFIRLPLPSSAPSGSRDLVVYPSRTLQTLRGFGGAFNEQGWAALSVLAESERQAVLRQLFDPALGLRLNLARTPIGASDYAMDRYTLDEHPGDYGMDRFSIERDRQRLLPFIKAALRIRPDLRVWASAWTPPTWMKTNGAFDSGAMKDDPRTYAAYALYLSKFVASYRAEGVDVFMVVPQNEPGQLTQYPSCDWTPAQYTTFIAKHLGPLFRAHHPDTRIFVGTINRGNWDLLSVLRDPGAGAFVSGVALQWGGLEHVVRVRQAFPKLEIMQSETECGNEYWKPGFDPRRAPNDFAYAAYTWRKFRNYIDAGSSSYFLWNLVLDEGGMNIDTQRPWPQNSAVVVDRRSRKVMYTPMFWATKHFSGLVDPGAHLVETNGTYADAIAFKNPDGSVIVELLNASSEPVELNIAIGKHSFAPKLPARSFASVCLR